jgi:transcriptional regulator with XRE-family HTH domain
MGMTLLARKIRSGYGLHRVSSRKIAEQLGVSEVSAKSWANGAFRPEGENLLGLARLLGVDAGILSDFVPEDEAIRALAAAYRDAPIRRELDPPPSDDLASRRKGSQPA